MIVRSWATLIKRVSDMWTWPHLSVECWTKTKIQIWFDHLSFELFSVLKTWCSLKTLILTNTALWINTRRYIKEVFYCHPPVGRVQKVIRGPLQRVFTEELHKILQAPVFGIGLLNVPVCTPEGVQIMEICCTTTYLFWIINSVFD